MHACLVHIAAQHGQKAPVRRLAGRMRGCQPLSARFHFLFIQFHAMAASGESRRRRHAGRASAYDHDAAGSPRRRKHGVRRFAQYARIDGAAYAERRDILAGSEAQAVYTADAGTDMRLVTGAYLFHPQGISQQRTAQCDEIRQSFLQERFRQFGPAELSHADQRLLRHFASFRQQRSKDSFRLEIPRGNIPQFFLRPAKNMKGIRPGPIQNGYDPASFFHLKPQISQQIVNCHTDYNRHTPACSPFHRLQQLTGEPGAVFRTSPVFVRTSVAVRRHEHAHKLAGTGVELKQIEPGLGRAPRGQFKFPDINLYFLNGQSVGNGVLIGKTHGGGGYGANAFGHAGSSCSHLGHGFCPGGMDAVNDAFQMGNK